MEGKMLALKPGFIRIALLFLSNAELRYAKHDQNGDVLEEFH